MKRTISLLLVALLLATGAGAFAQKQNGTARGFGGDISVFIETDERGVITAITASGPFETEEIGGQAVVAYNDGILPALIGTAAEALDASALDGVSGATVTSEAVKAAIADALDMATAQEAEIAALTAQLAAANDQIASLEAGTAISKPALSAWLADRTNVAAAKSVGHYLPGEENAPTDEALTRILETAGNYMWCHLMTAPHFIVIRDPAEQQAILGSMGITGDGTVTVLVLADGVSDQEHHVEPYTGREVDINEDEHYWQMYYCIYEAGEAAAMLNLAAIAEGYRVRSYGALDLYNQGVKDAYPDGNGVDIWYAGGNFDCVFGANWDISKYTTSKDGTEQFTHYFKGGHQDGQPMVGRDVAVEGNLTLLCAITIGKIDELDAVSSATGVSTGRAQNANYDFWD